MVAANKLLHLLEAFTTPWFLFSSPQNHHLAFYLLEVFNNIIQYQFDGGSEEVGSSRQLLDSSSHLWCLSLGNFNLVYAIIRKRGTFHHLANLPCDTASIQKALQRKKKSGVSRSRSLSTSSSTGSSPLSPAKPGALKASLEATPGEELCCLRWEEVTLCCSLSGAGGSEQRETIS